MADALAADFAAIEGCRLVLLRDARLGDWSPPAHEVCDVADARQAQRAFDACAARADWTLVVAPETGGLLAHCCRRVADAGGRVLGSPPELVELAADKHATALWLERRGVPVPAGCLVERDAALPADFAYPAVVKPRDGAGSLGVCHVASRSAAALVPFASTERRLEQFCPGVAVSVAVLCGPRGHVALPACRQRLSTDGRFRYFGGELPLPGALAERATRLTERAISALPPARGYLGVDLVLGDAASGERDVVIEVNPRLTTSYVGLRAALSFNLAAAMLAQAQGEPCVLNEPVRPVQFDADGSVRYRSSTFGS